MRERALAADGRPALRELQDLAKELSVWLLVGSLTLKTEGERIANRSCLISSDGGVVERYDKIHMFDATLPDAKVIRASSAYRPGDEAARVERVRGMLPSVEHDVDFETPSPASSRLASVRIRHTSCHPGANRHACRRQPNLPWIATPEAMSRTLFSSPAATAGA
jgi:predicted amidohydrolase